MHSFQAGLTSLQKLESRALRRETIANEEKEKKEPPPPLSAMYNNAFPVFDTYESFRANRNRLMLQKITGQELATIIKEEEDEFKINITELNITCCIMMLDVLYKQVNVFGKILFKKTLLILLRKINILYLDEFIRSKNVFF